jgi:predicted dinucleotide-binding enzyme
MTYAILGSGAIGTALIRRFVASGIEVSLANTRARRAWLAWSGSLGPW